MGAPVPHEEQRRPKNRGLWNICSWCNAEFEGAPRSGDFCSWDCYAKAEESRRYMEDLQDEWPEIYGTKA